MLQGSVQPRQSVSDDDVERMYRLFCNYYTHVRRDVFYRDWKEKHWALTLRDESGDLRGFTTLMLYDLKVLGKRIRAVFNGNTIIDRDCWGEQELVRTWCTFMSTLKTQQPDLPLYWFLISSGYRTYLFLPLFFREFFPRYDRSTPPLEQHIIDSLGRLKFPGEYRDGIVRVSEQRECFRSDLAKPSPGRLRNDHVKFFVTQNPNFARGDELVCLTEFSFANTKRMAHEKLAETLMDKNVS